MSIGPVVTRGYGNFGTANLVVTRGYTPGAAIAVVTTTTDTGGGGPIPRRNYHQWARALDEARNETGKKRKKQLAEIDATIEQAVEALFRDVVEVPAEVDKKVDLPAGPEVGEIKRQANDVRAALKSDKIAGALTGHLEALDHHIVEAQVRMAERRRAYEAFLQAREDDDLAVLILAS